MKISIVVPALNEEKQLPILLDSIRPVTSATIEVIVVDGNSEDKTAEVALGYKKKLSKGIELEVIRTGVRNVAYQRNLGAKSAQGEVIVFLDADTILPPPNQFEKLVTQFRAGGYAAASTRFRPIEKDWRAEIYYAILYGFHKIMERWNPYAVGSCILTNRSTLDHCGGFDPTIKINEDAEFAKRSTRCGRFKIFNIPVRVSSRRFKKYGYFRMTFRYLRIFLRRTFFGELRDTKIPYEFGKYE